MKNTQKLDPLPYFAVMMAYLLVLNAVFGVPLRQEQHAALMALYDGTGCSANVCPRFAVNEECTGSGLICSAGAVTRVERFEVGLTGTISSELGRLTALTYLSFANNQLDGTIPSQVGRLIALTDLYLDRNQLDGTIPSQVGRLTALTYLYLDNNQLEGTIASQVGRLTALRELYLYSNQLEGTIPSQVGLLTALRSFWLFDNNFVGPVPALSASILSSSSCRIDGNGLSAAFFTNKLINCPSQCCSDSDNQSPTANQPFLDAYLASLTTTNDVSSVPPTTTAMDVSTLLTTTTASSSVESIETTANHNMLTTSSLSPLKSTSDNQQTNLVEPTGPTDSSVTGNQESIATEQTSQLDGSVTGSAMISSAESVIGSAVIAFACTAASGLFVTC